MRASSRLSHHSPSGGGVSVNAPRIAKPSACSAASAVSMRDVGMASSAASAAAVVGPKPSSRPRTASTSAASLLTVCARPAGVVTAGSGRAAGKSAAKSGSRSAVTQTPAPAPTMCVTRRCAASWAIRSVQPAPRATSASVRYVSHSSASCSSSASVASGQASSRTRRMASASSLPKSAALCGSSQRRLITAWVRRSSRGASSR